MIKVFYDQFNGTMKFKKQRFKLHTGLIGLLLIFVLADANPRPTRSSVMFEDCGSQLDLKNVYMANCTSLPCQLYMGRTVQVNAEFADDDKLLSSNNLVHQAYWIINFVSVKATITPDQCTGNNCPIHGRDGGLEFTADLTVNKTLPAVRGTLMWQLSNGNEKLICYKIPISLVQEKSVN